MTLGLHRLKTWPACPQIMAGVDQEFQGESRLSDWAKVGYLEQEPKLDDGETVSSNIEAAVVPTRTLLKDYEKVGILWVPGIMYGIIIHT